jgi:hypothetical protein
MGRPITEMSNTSKFFRVSQGEFGQLLKVGTAFWGLEGAPDGKADLAAATALLVSSTVAS